MFWFLFSAKSALVGGQMLVAVAEPRKGGVGGNCTIANSPCAANGRVRCGNAKVKSPPF